MAHTELDQYEFRTKAPSWVDIPSGVQHHVGVVEDAGSNQYYKALLMLDNGQQRWWVWDDNDRMPYGPDLPPAIVKMLVAYMDEQ